MTQSRGFRSICTIAAAIALIYCATHARADCPSRYTVEVVLAPAGCSLIPIGFNNHSEVVGIYGCGVSYGQAFYWSRQSGFSPVSLGAGIIESEALAIGDDGTIVGSLVMVNGIGYQAYRRTSDGTLTVLGFPPDVNFSEAVGVDSSGRVLGNWSNGNTVSYRAFIWDNGVITDIPLPLPPPGPTDNSRAKSWNSKGMVAGWIGGNWTFNSVGFIWDGSRATIVPPIAGAQHSACDAVNSFGHAACDARFGTPGDPNSTVKPFWWNGTESLPLPLLPGYTRGNAIAIAENDDVVGRCFNYFGPIDTGVLWHQGRAYNLNSLTFGPNAKYHLWYAVAINKNGEILCDGNGGGLILHPVGPLIGDSNCDQRVNIDDILDVIIHWGVCPPQSNCPGDLNNDSQVDLNDLMLVVTHWSTVS